MNIVFFNQPCYEYSYLAIFQFIIYNQTWGCPLQTTFKIRQFELNDLESVVNINHACLPENYSSSFFTNLYQRFPATFIVAEDNKTVIGYAMCRIERGIPSSKRFGFTRKGHLISIAVLPEYQRKSVGHALMRKIMEGMISYNATECFLEVRVSNLPAINLYKKLDFEISRTKKRYYADGENAYLMSRKLNSNKEHSSVHA